MHRLSAEAIELPLDRAPGAGPSAGPRPALSEASRRHSSLFRIAIELAQPAEMLDRIVGWKRDGAPRQVMRINSSVVNRSRELPELAQMLSTADLIYCDDYSVQLAARALGRPVPPRMAGADWVWGLAALCESSGRSLYLLGAEPPLARESAERLGRRHPSLVIAGSHHGCADPDSPQNERLIEDINAKRPDIVLVGMGTPKQELWAARYGGQLDVGVVWTVGSLFDQLARGAPQSRGEDSPGGGLRLGAEPRRTWRRCFIDNPIFLSHVLGEARRRRASPS